MSVSACEKRETFFLDKEMSNNLDIPRIIPATINLIEDNATEMYVTDNNFGDNFKVLNKIPPQG